MNKCLETPRLYSRRFNLTTYWFLWRTTIPDSGYLEVNETLRIPIREVYLLIEMPLLGANPPPPGQGHVFGCLMVDENLKAMIAEKYGTWCIDATEAFEPVYLALSHPVFGLASSFAWVNEMEAYRMAMYGVGVALPYFGFRTVLMARLFGGVVCEGASTSTAMAASLLGYPAITSDNYTLLHTISGYLRLSSMGEYGAIPLSADLDGDGVLDSYDLLVDTAMLPLENVTKSFTTVRMYCFPLVCISIPSSEDRSRYEYFAEYAGVAMSLIGVPQVVLRAPEWLKTPAMVRYQWLTEKLVNESLSNIAPLLKMKSGFDRIYGYVYDEEEDAFVPVGNRSYVYLISPGRYPIVVEPALKAIFAEKGVGPGLFAPPSAPHTKPVLGYLPVLYEDREIPNTKRYLVEGIEKALEQLPPWER